METKQENLTTQNKLIIFGLLLSTFLIMAIAIFAIFNIQKKLNEGYHNFGKVISKTLAIESVEIIKNIPQNEVEKSLSSHMNMILKGHSDIVLIEFRDANGKVIYSGENYVKEKSKKSTISVNSPMMITKNGKIENIGSVTVGLSGSIINDISSTTRASMLFVFSVAWIVFAFVILINTYLITRELRILHNGVKQISSGKFGYTIENQEVSHEVRELFNSFNNMSSKLHIYEEQNIEQLTLEKNKMEAILMSIANGVVVCDNNDNVVMLNEHAKALLDVENHQLLDNKIQNYIDAEGRFCFKDKIEEFKDTPLEIIEKKPIEFSINVDELVIKSIISPMFTRNKDYVGYIIVLIDMTKEARVDAMRSTFISNVSHELRTPVTVLRTYIDTLYNFGDEFDYQTQKEFIGTINQEIIRLNAMVNDILDFSRMESNTQMQKSLNDLALVVEKTVEQVGVLAKENNIKINISKGNDLPDLLFNYDNIQRAITNYLSNAIKYSPKDGVIDIKMNYLDVSNEVEFSITDYGCGISAEHQKKVFDRFYRVENNTHTVKGTGLGLHLVKTTIEKYHAGKVFVISELNKGATFGFRLPVSIELENLEVN
ncbi:MAG: ATP-binding protein [Candidatus Gastranaerophilales bacterium]